jgi:hypothetical protein
VRTCVQLPRILLSNVLSDRSVACLRVVYYNQDVVDRNKIFPGIIAAEQLIPKVEALGKHLGGFHKNKVQILSALHTATTQWLSGGKVPPGGAKKTMKY